MMINNASCHIYICTQKLSKTNEFISLVKRPQLHTCAKKLSKTTTTSLLFLKIWWWYTANPVGVPSKFDSIECHLTLNIGDDLCTYLYLSGLPNIISQLHYSSGKTTILYRLKLGKQLDFVIPTVSFNVETIDNRAGVTFSIWDFGGGDKIRPLWKHHVPLPSGERPNQRISLLLAIYTSSKYNFKNRKYCLNQESSGCDKCLSGYMNILSWRK